MFCTVEAGWGTLAISLTFKLQSLAYSKLCGVFIERMNVIMALESLAFRRVETWEDGVCSGQAGF